MPATDDIVFGPAHINGDRACPDCHAPSRTPCHRTCPRRGDPDEAHDLAFEQAQAGDHPDGF